MYEDIGESIRALILFENGRALPRSFSWRGRKYQIDNINLEHQEQRGKDLVFCFAVSASGNNYELSFNSHLLTWTLERTWQ